MPCGLGGGWILWIYMEVRDIASARILPYHDINGAATQSCVMDRGSRKCQVRWNISSDSGL